MKHSLLQPFCAHEVEGPHVQLVRVLGAVFSDYVVGLSTSDSSASRLNPHQFRN